MRFLTGLTIVSIVCAQSAGTLTQERHPQLSVEYCTKGGGCQVKQQSVTIDANWRWTHQIGQPKNCFTGNTWDATLCPDPASCTKNCCIDGAGDEYTNTYGVHGQGETLQLDYVTQGPYSKNIGSRTYLLAPGDELYQMYHLKNKEFTFTVDDSQLPCGLNGALYFVAMDEDGGKKAHPTNTAGAKYGTGYCDAQCPHDVKFINGQANSMNWKPSPVDSNSGTGHYGTCCVEMDIWEANSISTAYTPHACSVDGPTQCEGQRCGDTATGDRFKGVCDKNGCDLQTYRLGNKKFWGPGAGFTIDSTQPVTVVTQFITADNTDRGALSEIRRHYVQNGKVIQTPSLTFNGKTHNSVSKSFCQDTLDYFKDNTNFLSMGGLDSMGKAMDRGMVLVMSLWDDHDVHMLWLDSTYPTNGTGTPGAERGTCPITSGNPADIENQFPKAHVKFSNIKFGDIGSTAPGLVA